MTKLVIAILCALLGIALAYTLQVAGVDVSILKSAVIGGLLGLIISFFVGC